MELDSIISNMKWETAVLGDPLAPMRNRHSVLTEPVSYLLETGVKAGHLVYASLKWVPTAIMTWPVAAVKLHLASLVHDDLLIILTAAAYHCKPSMGFRHRFLVGDFRMHVVSLYYNHWENKL